MSFWSDLLKKGKQEVQQHFTNPVSSFVRKEIPTVRQVFQQSLPTPQNFQRQVVQPIRQAPVTQKFNTGFTKSFNDTLGSFNRITDAVQPKVQNYIQNQTAKRNQLMQQHPTITKINAPANVIGQFGAGMPKAILRGTTRSAGQIYNTIRNKPTFTPQGSFAKLVYGQDQVGDVQNRVQTDTDWAEKKGFKGNTAKTVGASLAMLGLMGDVTPIGGGKKKAGEEVGMGALNTLKKVINPEDKIVMNEYINRFRLGYKIDKTLEDEVSAIVKGYGIKAKGNMGLADSLDNVLQETATKGREFLRTGKGKGNKYAGSRAFRDVVPGISKNANNPMYGGIAGVEPYQDENGKTRFRFNPYKAAAGMAVMGGVKYVGKGKLPKPGEVVSNGGKVNLSNSVIKGKISSNGVNSTVGDIIDNPALFKQFPELANKKIITKPYTGGLLDPTTAYIDPKTKDIVIYTGGETNPEVSLLHELQHYTQGDIKQTMGVRRALTPQEMSQIREINSKIQPAIKSGNYDEVDKLNSQIIAIQNKANGVEAYNNNPLEKEAYGVVKDYLNKSKIGVGEVVSNGGKQLTNAEIRQGIADGVLDPKTPLSPRTSTLPKEQIQVSPKSNTGQVPSNQNSSFDTNLTDVSGNVKKRGFTTSSKESVFVSTKAKKDIEGTYKAISNQETINAASKRIKKSQIAAHDFALNDHSAEGTATAIELARKYRNKGKFDLEASLLNDKAARLTEAGQEVQAASLIDQLSPEGVIISAAKMIQKYNKTARTPIPEITGELAKDLSSQAIKIGKMAEGREKNIAIYKMKDQLNNLIPSTLLDKFVTVWKAGLLTSLRTTERNIIGNTVHGTAEMAKDPFAVVNDILLSLKTGRREVTFTTKGTISGAKTGGKAAADIYTMGFDPEQSIKKFDVKRVTWGNNPVEQGLKKYTDFVFRNMGAQDKVFYHSSFARSLYDQAGAEAINAGKRGDRTFIENLVKNPTERMKVNATKDAQVAVFQNKNLISGSINKFKSFLGDNDKSGTAKAVSDVLMPFTGVPSSIAGQMVAYSPIGFTRGVVDNIKVLGNLVKPEMIPDLQRQASQEIGRGIIGTGLLAIGVYLTKKGLMSGQPKDANEAKQWELEGKQANSVMVNGKWRSINSIGPEALIVLAGSKMATGEDAATTAAGIGKDFTNQTFLQGVQGPLNAINDPQRFGTSYVSNQIASGIPNILKDVSKALDPTQRETLVSKNVKQSTINSLKSGVPLLRNTLLPKRDALGNSLPNETTGYKAFVDLFNSKTPVSNPVVNELSRLFTASESATPSKLTPSQTINGKKINLQPKDLDLLESYTGEELQKYWGQVMNDPEYLKLSDADKSNKLGNFLTDVRTVGKVQVAYNSGQLTIDEVKSAYDKMSAKQKEYFDTGNLNISLVKALAKAKVSAKKSTKKSGSKISAASKQAKKDETARLARLKSAISSLKSFKVSEYAKPVMPTRGKSGISGVKTITAAELARGR